MSGNRYSFYAGQDRSQIGSGKPLPKFIYVDDFADASEAAVRVRAGASLKRKFVEDEPNQRQAFSGVPSGHGV